jgi:hypothetical protein
VSGKEKPAQIEIPSLQSKTGSEIMHRKDYSESILLLYRTKRRLFVSHTLLGGPQQRPFSLFVSAISV